MIETVELQANGMTFTCRQAGAGEPVLLLHGFPETSIMWCGLMEMLAADGYRCLAPDQRGYSPRARPEGVAAYDYHELLADTIAIADAAGIERFHLVGHDWGSLLGWAVVSTHGDRVASWTAMSCPHTQAFARAVRDDPEEEAYRGILTFVMTEGGPEAWATQNGGVALRAAYTNHSDAEIDEYLRVLSQPGAMAGAANWYRASRAHARSIEDPAAPYGKVSVPTLGIRGTKDPYVRGMAWKLADEYMTGPYRVAELDAGHWLVQEAPERVAEEIRTHLRANPIG